MKYTYCVLERRIKVYSSGSQVVTGVLFTFPFALERFYSESNANVSFSDREQNIPLTVGKTLATPLKVLMEQNSIFLTTWYPVTVWNDAVRLKAMRLCLTQQTRAWSSALKQDSTSRNSIYLNHHPQT